MKTKIIMLHVPEDFDTSLVGTNLPADTLYACDVIDNKDLTNESKMASHGRSAGLAMYRGFAFRENPDIYPDYKERMHKAGRIP